MLNALHLKSTKYLPLQKFVHLKLIFDGYWEDQLRTWSSLSEVYLLSKTCPSRCTWGQWCVRLVHICHAGERKQIGRRLPLITLVGMRSCGLREGENNKPLSANKGHTQLSHATEQSAPSCSLPLVPATNRHSPLIKVSKFASEKLHCLLFTHKMTTTILNMANPELRGWDMTIP